MKTNSIETERDKPTLPGLKVLARMIARAYIARSMDKGEGCQSYSERYQRGDSLSLEGNDDTGRTKPV